jgi:hypothetical protein
MLHLHADEARPAATSGTTAVPGGAAAEGSAATASTPAGNAGAATSTPAANTASPAALGKAGKGARPSNRGNVGQSSAAAYGQSPQEAQSATDAAAQAAAEQQELDRLTHQYNLLEARMASFDASMDTMRQAQAQQGMNMRGDMASAQHRLHGNMERMQTALDQKDLTSAKRYLELCDRDAEKLSDFLGQ